jgi:hypothetical protein
LSSIPLDTPRHTPLPRRHQRFSGREATPVSICGPGNESRSICAEPYESEAHFRFTSVSLPFHCRRLPRLGPGNYRQQVTHSRISWGTNGSSKILLEHTIPYHSMYYGRPTPKANVIFYSKDPTGLPIKYDHAERVGRRGNGKIKRIGSFIFIIQMMLQRNLAYWTSDY